MLRLLGAIASGLKRSLTLAWQGFLYVADTALDLVMAMVPGHAAAQEAEAAAQAQIVAAHDQEAQRLEAADRNASGAACRTAASYLLARREPPSELRISEKLRGWLRALTRTEIAVVAATSSDRLGEHIGGKRVIAGLPPAGDSEAVAKWRRTPDGLRKPARGSDDEATLNAAMAYMRRLDDAQMRREYAPDENRLRTERVRLLTI
jgi:hypothetical protein